MNFPAGIDEGFEIYLHQGHLRVLNNGVRSEYVAMPKEIRDIFLCELFSDLSAWQALESMGHKTTEGKELCFIGCRYGSLDSKSDLTGSTTEPDAPNCTKMKGCPGFGYVCRIPNHLSRHEYLIAHYIGKGHLDKEICSIMKISLPTCRTFQGRIHKKLQLNNRVEIGFWAQKLGIA